MSGTFKVDAKAFQADSNAYKKSSEQLDPTVNVSRMSVCSGLIIDQYVDKLEALGQLIQKYKDLVQKDCKDFNDIADDIKAQEAKWATSISNH